METELFSSAMNKPCSSPFVGVLMSACRITEQEIPSNNRSLEKEIQSVYDEDDYVEESENVSGKKRRLGEDQVKALEKYFEQENKLEPERKVKLARELGLRPRQVAVWFQNRRARWKTKQLERDYGDLKANYDALKLNFDTLRRDNEVLLEEIKGVKAKLVEDVMLVESTAIEQTNPFTDNPFPVESESADLNCQSFNSNNIGGELGYEISFFATDLKDGSFDESDSSAILHEECVPKGSISSPGAFHNNQQLSSRGSSLNCFQLQKGFQPHLLAKMEEHNFFSGEEDSSFFTTNQASTLQWCHQDEWD